MSFFGGANQCKKKVGGRCSSRGETIFLSHCKLTTFYFPRGLVPSFHSLPKLKAHYILLGELTFGIGGAIAPPSAPLEPPLVRPNRGAPTL